MAEPKLRGFVCTFSFICPPLYSLTFVNVGSSFVKFGFYKSLPAARVYGFGQAHGSALVDQHGSLLFCLEEVVQRRQLYFVVRGSVCTPPHYHSRPHMLLIERES